MTIDAPLLAPNRTVPFSYLSRADSSSLADRPRKPGYQHAGRWPGLTGYLAADVHSR